MIVLRSKGDLHPAQIGDFQAVLVMESLLHIKIFIPSEKLKKKNIYFWKNKEIEVEAESLCFQNITIIVHSLILHAEAFHNKKLTYHFL